MLTVRARTRLLLAFLILASSCSALAFMGWRSLEDTATAVDAFEQHSLPEISRSLELAERTANLAAIAPYLAAVSSPFMLQGLSQTLEEKITHVLELAANLPRLDAASPDLRPLLTQLEQNTKNLIATTRQILFTREDMRQDSWQLQQLQNLSNGQQQLVQQLQLAIRADDPRELETLQQGLQPLQQQYPLTSAPGLPERLLERRLQQLRLQEQSAWLLASTRAISEQLSNSVTHFVDQARLRINQESRQVAHTATSGQTGIIIISLLCLVAAGAGIVLVHGLSSGLEQVTRVMSQLAEGQLPQQTPALERHDELGELARAFEVFRENAVEKERISRNLQEQTRLLETVFSNISDGLSVFDDQGRLLAWNPRYASMLELPAHQIRRGMTLNELHNLLPPAARDSWTQIGTLIDSTTINDARRYGPLRFERHFSNGREVEFRSSPLPDGGFVTLYTDLTERKAIEAQLRQAQKMEVLGQLTGGVAHDFNNLLAAMFGNLQLLEDSLAGGQGISTSQSERALTRVRRALAAAERGSSLTRRLLAFSRKQQLHPVATEVDSLIEGMEDLFKYSIAQSIRLDLQLQSAPALVEVDPGQLENALLNLAINASAAMSGGGTLTIRTSVLTAQPLPQLQILIRDTGCGIPREHLNRVFEPFFTTKDIGEGSGLGLSMVYGFVKQSSGDIRIDSEVGAGTRISIQLPLASSAQPSEAAIKRDDTAPGHNPPPDGQPALLLVEDDIQVAEVTREQLQCLGYQVHHCSNAEQARHYLSNTDLLPLLVFSDINLGSGATGLQLRHWIQQQWPGLPVLLTSGLTARQLQERYGENPQPLLSKPYQQQQLAQMLSTCLTHGSGEPS